MYYVIIDSCSDMVADNLSVGIRYVDMKNSVVIERFVQFVQLEYHQLNAKGISQKVCGVLNQPERNFHLCLLLCDCCNVEKRRWLSTI